jgi:hypothetical protein
VIILDTNVLSEIARPNPEPKVIAWLDAIPLRQRWTTTVVIFELWHGVERLPHGRRRANLDALLRRVVDMTFGERIVGFDQAAALSAAACLAERRRSGRPTDPPDAMIAGVARVHECRLATRNTRDFDGLGLDLVNPWSD